MSDNTVKYPRCGRFYDETLLLHRNGHYPKSLVELQTMKGRPMSDLYDKAALRYFEDCEEAHGADDGFLAVKRRRHE